MRTIVVTGMVLLPHLLFAGTDCWVSEYEDRYIAECIGDSKNPLSGETVSKAPGSTVQPVAIQEQGKILQIPTSRTLDSYSTATVRIKEAGRGMRQHSSQTASGDKVQTVSPVPVLPLAEARRRAVRANSDDMPTAYRAPRSILANQGKPSLLQSRRNDND